MVCVYCGSETRVINSRPQRRRNQIWRRRECLNCHTVFTTEETAQYDSVWRVRGAAGTLQPFSRDKLLLSLYKSCQHRPDAISDAAGLTDTITRKLASEVHDGVIEPASITQVAMVTLNRFDKVATTHYIAFHKTQ